MNSVDFVTLDGFRDEVNREVEWLKNGATSYRVKTAELSLLVVKEIETPDYFCDLKTAIKKVSELFPNEDSERKKDVAKMLHTIFSSMELELETPQEIK